MAGPPTTSKPRATAPPPVAIPSGASPAAPKGVAPLVPGKLTRRKIGYRIATVGMPGWGKTSMVAYAPNPLVIMCGNERGYETLLNANRVPDINALHVDDWETLKATLRSFVGNCPYEHIGFDTIGGLERMCHAHICATQFAGNWGEKGFNAFKRGYEIAITEILILLDLLDELVFSGVSIHLLGHSIVKPFQNPEGSDYHTYRPDVHEKTWACMERWVDAAFLGKFETIIEKEEGKGRAKGKGGETRLLCTSRHDAYPFVKNRYGMPSVIQMPDTAAEVWLNIEHYIKNGADAA